MQHLLFTEPIKASRERIWQVLWDEATYPHWTAPFGEGGQARSDWKEGSRVYFLSAEGDGMFALIDRKDEPGFISFTHQGVFKDGQEQPQDEATKVWSGAREQYTLKEHDGGTILTVEMDVVDSEAASFQQMFPKALAIVKRLAEG